MLYEETGKQQQQEKLHKEKEGTYPLVLLQHAATAAAAAAAAAFGAAAAAAVILRGLPTRQQRLRLQQPCSSSSPAAAAALQQQQQQQQQQKRSTKGENKLTIKPSPFCLYLLCSLIPLPRELKMSDPRRIQRRVQTFGRKKTAIAVALCTEGKGIIRINGSPIHLLKPEALRVKACESILVLGKERFEGIDIRVRVRGGGFVSQVYAIRQAIAKGVVAYHQKYVDEATKKEIRDALVACDRSLVVADPRRCEPKKFGGPGARARYQKSYR